jgi:DNA (cytosine-5)-methyltransferase 1
MQAGQYGSPQSRKRVIFWGTKRGTLLPEFPVPTHCFRGSFFYKFPTGNSLSPTTCSKNPDICHVIAPFNAVTVNDAIGDLVSVASVRDLLSVNMPF